MSEDTNFEIIFDTVGGDRVRAAAALGESLLDVAKRAGIAIDAPCSGNGTCGKCRVILRSGELTSAPGPHLAGNLYDEGYRLACVSEVSGDCEVEIPESAIAFQTKIRTTDCSSPEVIANYAELKQLYAGEDLASGQQVGVLEIQVSEPSLDDPEADLERIKRAAAESLDASSDLLRFSLPALANLPKILRDNSYKVYLTYRKEVKGNYTILASSAEAEHPIGAAVDIGTTTVSLLLVDLLTGTVLASGSAGNGQIRFGADVINRLIESSRKGGVERLRKAIADECIAPLITTVASKISRDASDVLRIAITGNTTMIHLLLGVYGDYLRQEPYVPAFFNAKDFIGCDLSLPIHHDASVVIAPSVGSYVGGDITAGTMIAGVSDNPAFSLFIDLGTNGEIVFGSQDFMMTCACSAGPAFEGGDISSGMRATDGAIEAISIDDATMEPTLSIIGEANQKPVGICGSGLIDLVSELFRTRIVDAKGKFIRESERIKKDGWDITRYVVAAADETENGEEVYISDADIDNFIRAKGSIFSAIRTMLLMTDMEIDFIEDIYIAGGIGSGIDFDKAIRIGMLPDIDRSHYHYIGNTSLNGAYCMLLSDSAVAKVDAIAGGMTYVELSSYPAYMDEFIAACFLPHTNASLFGG